MNTTVLNTAVQAALTSQGYTVGRAGELDNIESVALNTLIQAALTAQGFTVGRAGYLDNIETVAFSLLVQAGLDDQGYTDFRAEYLDILDLPAPAPDPNAGIVKLSADGLDDLVISEPSGDPDTWSVPQKLMWLIMRFMNKHTSDNFSGIVVHKDDGSVSTSQAVTEVDGVKSVSKVQ